MSQNNNNVTKIYILDIRPMQQTCKITVTAIVEAFIWDLAPKRLNFRLKGKNIQVSSSNLSQNIKTRIEQQQAGLA